MMSRLPEFHKLIWSAYACSTSREVLPLLPHSKDYAIQIAQAVLWLSSPGASLMLGHAMVVDGASTVH